MKSSKNKKASVRTTPARPSGNTTTVRHPAAYDDAAADAFIQEVTEEVKNDSWKAFWNKYGLFVILLVVITVSAAVSYETIKGWKEKQYQTRTENYLTALETSENYENSLKALEKIAAAGQGIYSELARIQIAGILFEQNKNDEAEAMLQSIIDNEELNSRIRQLAAVKLATYKIDTAPRAELQSLLQPIADAQNSWSPLAQEMLAMTAIRNGDLDAARDIYKSLLNNGNISENFRTRIQDMLSALNDM